MTRLAEWILQNHNPTMCCLQEEYFTFRDKTCLQVMEEKYAIQTVIQRELEKLLILEKITLRHK